MDISYFQLDSVIGHPTENPCVGGSIPSLATNRINKLQQAARPAFLLLGQIWDNFFRPIHQSRHLSIVKSPSHVWRQLIDFARLPTRVRGSRSTGLVVELREVERPHPRLAAPREYLGFRREPLVEAIESAFLHENDARSVLQVVGEHPGTAVGTEDAVEPLARTCFGIWTVGEALGVSAEHGEIRVRHRHECRHLSAGRPLAIRAVAVCDKGRLGIEPVRHLAAGTVTGVLLAHVISPSRKMRCSPVNRPGIPGDSFR